MDAAAQKTRVGAVSRAKRRRSRLMRSGRVAGWDGECRRYRQRPCRGLRRADRLDRRWRQRCRQQHAADAARINANVAAVVVLRRRRRAAGLAVADHRRRTGGRERRGAARRQAREQPAKRQRIGGHERNDAPPQRPSGEMPMHVERFPLPGPEHRSAEQIPRPADDARFAAARVVSATPRERRAGIRALAAALTPNAISVAVPGFCVRSDGSYRAQRRRGRNEPK